MHPEPGNPHRRPIRPIDPMQLRPRRQVFDIARPGRMPAPSTSRPLVTGHQPTVTDPSVTVQKPPQHAMLRPRPVIGMEVVPTAPSLPAAPARGVEPTLQPIAPTQPANPPAAPYSAQVTGGLPAVDDLSDSIAPMHISEEPVLISKHVPQGESRKWRWVTVAAVIFLFALIIFDILLDADFITLHQVPHTHFF